MIHRFETGQRMSQLVKYNGVAYLAGQVGIAGTSVREQTEECLKRIDKLLDQAGSDNKQILQAIIWLADMKDFEEMNQVWDAWIPQGHAPARACGQADLATPDFTVEIIITAACSD